MSVLFSPIAVKGVNFRNRVVMAPMVCAGMPPLQGRVDPDGRVSDAALDHYARRAAAGTAMIIVEATAVDAGGRCWSGGLCAHSDDFLPGLRRVAERIHAGGAVACIQLVHGGPQASTELTQRPLATPSSLSAEEILRIEERFAQAAERCVAAGFDGVEVHGAHGFLLDSFLSTTLNTRSDDYGGTIEGRMRMLIETCKLTKSRIGDKAFLECRVSAFNHLDEGFSADDLKHLVQGLEEAGVDLLHVSVMQGGALDGYFGSDKTIGQWVKGYTDLPLIVAGGLGNPRDAERAVSEAHADFAAVGSAMLDDPDWTKHARKTLG